MKVNITIEVLPEDIATKIYTDCTTVDGKVNYIYTDEDDLRNAIAKYVLDENTKFYEGFDKNYDFTAEVCKILAKKATRVVNFYWYRTVSNGWNTWMETVCKRIED